MKTLTDFPTPTAMTLDAVTAADLMTPKVVTIRENATLAEAVALLTEKRLSGLPVVNEEGHPVGVLSRGDIVAYDSRRYASLQPEAHRYERTTFFQRLTGMHKAVKHAQGDHPLVHQVMTKVVFSVAARTPASTVVDAMVTLHVHRMFVTDDVGDLLGVVSCFDIIKRLHGADTEQDSE